MEQLELFHHTDDHGWVPEETVSVVRRRICWAPRCILAEASLVEVGSGGTLSPLDLVTTGAKNLAAVKDAPPSCSWWSLSSTGRRA
jgi:hypothetical protein